MGQGRCNASEAAQCLESMQGSHTHPMCHLATLKPDKALQGLLHDPVLSDSSKLTYTQRLKAMSARRGQPITELAMQARVIFPWIRTVRAGVHR